MPLRPSLPGSSGPRQGADGVEGGGEGDRGDDDERAGDDDDLDSCTFLRVVEHGVDGSCDEEESTETWRQLSGEEIQPTHQDIVEVQLESRVGDCRLHLHILY